jgi:LmbE family N-acetylglucosaminyl deacetylase
MTAGGRQRATNTAKVAVIVAHPDDETLWAGGTLLSNGGWDCFVAALCRRSDPDRAPRFRKALERLGASGEMADLPDEPEQAPLQAERVRETVRSLLAGRCFDLLLTHGPWGEYTRHLRHEETSQAVMHLWQTGELVARGLWLFSYEDAGGRRPPSPRPDAHMLHRLDEAVWQRKYDIITKVYGFRPESFEARAAVREEAFWCFESRQLLSRWLAERRANRNEGAGSI